jgi:ABC-type lipopolysaccharide export system ATPase subunit
LKLTRCKICGEALRDPNSIRAGIGPVCAANLTRFLAAVGSSAEEIAALALIDDNVSRLLRCAERAAGLGHVPQAKSFIERAREIARFVQETTEVKAA